jgi:hypothetical protein
MKKPASRKTGPWYPAAEKSVVEVSRDQRPESGKTRADYLIGRPVYLDSFSR